MIKETSISMHLAKVMGLRNIQTAPEQYQVGERVTHELTDIRREIFNPLSNRAQWADVVLFAAGNSNYPAIGCRTSKAEQSASVLPFSVAHDSTDESRMAATLEAIALATGWAG